MLFSLHIRCVALIKELDIDLSEGLTVFTGETGAGKSIIIDSIALLCGARSDKSIIRTGEDSAEVEGVFGMLSSDVLKALETEEVYPDEEGNLFLTRRITADGRSVFRQSGDRPCRRLFFFHSVGECKRQRRLTLLYRHRHLSMSCHQ